MRRQGFGLVEVLVSAVVVATVLLGMAAFQTATIKVNSKEKDRAFAVQKAVQIMEEILAFQVVAGVKGTTNIDTLAQGDTEYSYALSIDPNVSDHPDMALSGNRAYKSSYRFVRQIHVEPVPNEKGARRVTVGVYYGDGGTTAAPSTAAPLAFVTNIVKAQAVKTQPTQVYDMYFIDIENMPGWWTDPNPFRNILLSTMDFLKSNNPGLEIRPHWIRRLSYGRDEYYKPIGNKANPCNNTSAVPLDYVYFYPGKLTVSDMKYNPDLLKGQMRVDGTTQNAMTIGNTPANYPENQTAYSFADQYNHAMRYPMEVEKFNNISNSSTIKPEPSLRMLLEQMASGQLRNAIVVNIPAELLPTVPMRNFSDPARVPQLVNDAATIASQWGVNCANSEIVEGSHCRLVTHPRFMRVSHDSNFDSGDPWYATNTVELRVFPSKDANYDTEPATPYRKGRVVVQNVKNLLHDWNSGGSAGDVEIDVLERVVTSNNASPTYDDGDYRWLRIWPSGNKSITGLGDASGLKLPQYGGSEKLADHYLDTANGHPGVEVMGSSDSNRDLVKGDLVIRLENIPYTHNPLRAFSGWAWNGSKWVPTYDYKGLPNKASGSARDMILHRLSYFPDPALPDLSQKWESDREVPRHTARFRILFKSDNGLTPDAPIHIVTSIGDDDAMQHHQYPNRSETYQWVDNQPPLTEQDQYVGDPRLNPYGDNRGLVWYGGEWGVGRIGSYNRLFSDFSNDNAYPNSSGLNAQWNSFGMANSWVGKNVDLPHYYELWREAFLNSGGLYLNPSGFSFYYYSLGGEVTGTPWGQVSSKPYDGGSSLIDPNDIISATRGVMNPTSKWYAVPDLGELYPDDEWTNWSLLGNLPSAKYRLTAYSDMPSWQASGANPDFSKIVAGDGCAAFFNGGSTGTSSDSYSHIFRTGDINHLTANGQSVANSFKMYLDSGYPSYRPFIIDSTNFPPNWNWSEEQSWRTKLEWGLTTGSPGYYDQANSTSELSVAPIVVRRTDSGVPKAFYAVMSAAAPSGDTGTLTLARMTIAASLQALFDFGKPTFADGTAKKDLAPKLLPRLNITNPVEDTQISGNGDWIKWNLTWARWNMDPYSTIYTNYNLTAYKPTMVYNIKFSIDSGASWKFLSDGAKAYPGVYDSGHAYFDPTGKGYFWDYSNKKTWPNREYLIRVEGFRSTPGGMAAGGYENTHYTYHQVAYTLAN